MIHTFLPKSMENYYRESGRAGRDGRMSESILFYSKGDNVIRSASCSIDPHSLSQILASKISHCSNSFIILHVVAFLKDDESVDEKSKDGELVKLEPMVEYCLKKKDCRRIQLLTYFGGVDTEANLCKKNTETICDNCERDNVSKQLYFNLTSSTKPVCRCQY